MIRWVAFGVIVAAVVGAFAYTVAGCQVGSRPDAIDAFEKVTGFILIAGNHAKGVCVTGFFDSNGNGVRLSKAVIFGLAACN